MQDKGFEWKKKLNEFLDKGADKALSELVKTIKFAKVWIAIGTSAFVIFLIIVLIFLFRFLSVSHF